MDWLTSVSVGVLTALAGAAVAAVATFLDRLLKRQSKEIRDRLSTEVPTETRIRSRLQSRDARQEQQYRLLREYHALGLAQSKVSFWFSIILATLGFCVVVAAILISMQSGVSLSQQGRAWITLVAGTVTQALSGLLFVQSNRARQLMTDFFEKLRSDRKLDEALALVITMKDARLRDDLRAVLALHFADSQLSPNVLPGLRDASSIENQAGNRSPS